MPVTIEPAPHGANKVKPGMAAIAGARELLPLTEAKKVKNDKIYQSSFKE